MTISSVEYWKKMWLHLEWTYPLSVKLILQQRKDFGLPKTFLIHSLKLLRRSYQDELPK